MTRGAGERDSFVLGDGGWHKADVVNRKLRNIRDGIIHSTRDYYSKALLYQGINLFRIVYF